MDKLKSCNYLSKKTSKIRINVRYSETDSMSFVHHSNYLKYYEIGRLAWFKNIGFSYKKLESENIILPVVETKIKFRKPAFFDDELVLETTVIKPPSYSIEFNYILKKNNELINEGYTKLIFLNGIDKKPIRCPKNILKKINDFL
jgi:acyl-CoA thioester hydrolase